MATVGTFIAGKYEILKLIGHGGMSEVYLAMDINLNKQLAVKEIKRNIKDANNDIIVQSAIAEANLMKRLDHPNLPRIVDIITRDDLIYVVMDYVEGETLKKILETEGAQNQDDVIEWAKELCDVLDYLHSQDPPIIYRDMKPANIMLQPNGNIKLIDFGIAREYKEQNLEDTVCLGTKGYAAPEQFGGKGQTDARTDIYCLGATLHHLLTGHSPTEPPYILKPIREYRSEFSGGLEKVINTCVNPDPDKRYQSCAELSYALLHYEEEDDSYRKLLWKKMSTFLGVIAMSLFFIILGVISMFLYFDKNNDDYLSAIRDAEQTIETGEKIAYYKKAVLIKTTNIEPYLGIVQAMKEDACFTVEEEVILKQILNTDVDGLRENSQYAELAYEVGKLYWYYYDYGKNESADNQITRMKSAVPWFEEACFYGKEEDVFYVTAMAYYEIGKFNKDIILNIEESSDKGLYIEYYQNLKMLFETVLLEESELVNLEVYKLSICTIELYANKLKRDGVEYSDIQEFFDAVCVATEQIEVSTDKTKLLKDSVMKRFENAYAAMENAYRE